MKFVNRFTGEVKEFDRDKARVRRMQKRVYRWATIVLDRKSHRDDCRLVMITLTYARLGEWAANAIRDYMLKLRAHCGEDLLAYAWVAELQEREAVHYHVVVLCKRGTDIPKPDASGMWAHGSSRIETARTPYYLAKYTGKAYQKMGPFPCGLRMFAVFLDGRFFDVDELRELRLECLPGYVRAGLANEILSTGRSADDIWPSPAVGGGWWIGTLKVISPWVNVGREARARLEGVKRGREWDVFGVRFHGPQLGVDRRREQAEVRASWGYG